MNNVRSRETVRKVAPSGLSKPAPFQGFGHLGLLNSTINYFSRLWLQATLIVVSVFFLLFILLIVFTLTTDHYPTLEELNNQNLTQPASSAAQSGAKSIIPIMPVVQSLPAAGNNLAAATTGQPGSVTTRQPAYSYSQLTESPGFTEVSKETEPVEEVQPEPGQLASNVDHLVITSQSEPVSPSAILMPTVTRPAARLTPAPTSQVQKGIPPGLINTPEALNNTPTAIPSAAPTRKQPPNSIGPGSTNTPVIQPQVPLEPITAFPSRATPTPTATAPIVPISTPVPPAPLIPTNTSVPTIAVEPTNTPVPIAPLVPTSTPVPTIVVVPTSTPVPTIVVVPTSIPVPTIVVVPTSIPVPTIVVVPTSIPVPTAIRTQAPTNTPEPTKKPKPTKK